MVFSLHLTSSFRCYSSSKKVFILPQSGSCFLSNDPVAFRSLPGTPGQKEKILNILLLKFQNISGPTPYDPGGAIPIHTLCQVPVHPLCQIPLCKVIDRRFVPYPEQAIPSFRYTGTITTGAIKAHWNREWFLESSGDLHSSQHKIPRLLITRVMPAYLPSFKIWRIFSFYGFIFIFTNTYLVKNISMLIPPRHSYHCCFFRKKTSFCISRSDML